MGVGGQVLLGRPLLFRVSSEDRIQRLMSEEKWAETMGHLALWLSIGHLLRP